MKKSVVGRFKESNMRRDVLTIFVKLPRRKPLPSFFLTSTDLFKERMTSRAMYIVYHSLFRRLSFVSDGRALGPSGRRQKYPFFWAVPIGGPRGGGGLE